MDSFTDDVNNPLPTQIQSEMMDDVRPLSLPTSDCAASDARRMEGRPATARQPASEQLGRMTSKRGTLAIASKVVSSEDPFRNLSDDILEHILAKLPPLSPLQAAKQVCKRWASVTSTPEFENVRKELNPKPRPVCCGINFLGPDRSHWFAYDVEKNAWVTLPAVRFPAHISHPITATSGVFSVVGPAEDRLLYKLTSSASSAESFGETWYETPVMTTFPRVSPVVSVAQGAGKGHKVVVAGGASGVRAVEVFDSEFGTWESYGDLPEALDDYCRNMTSGVVCDNKFYVSSLGITESGHIQIHILDFYTRQWASILLEPPEDLIYCPIMAIGTTLVVVGYCEDPFYEQHEVKLWKVDLETPSLIQIGSMPSELTAPYEDPMYVDNPITISVDENLVYFSMSGRVLVLGEVSLEECRTDWRVLPAHPGDPSHWVHHFFRFY